MRISVCLGVSVLGVVLGCGGVRAAVYRCVQSDGLVSYQQFRCSKDSQPLAIRQQSLGGTPLRPGERALLHRYAKPVKNRPARALPIQVPEADCSRLREQLAEVRTTLRRGYSLQAGADLHRQEDDYRAALQRSCND